MKRAKCFLCGASVCIRSSDGMLAAHSHGMSGINRAGVLCSASGMHPWTKMGGDR